MNSACGGRSSPGARRRGFLADVRIKPIESFVGLAVTSDAPPVDPSFRRRNYKFCVCAADLDIQVPVISK